MADPTWSIDDWFSRQQDLQSSQLKNSLQIAQGGWAVSREGIKSQLKIAKMNLDFQYKQMKEIGIPESEARISYMKGQEEIARMAEDRARAGLALDYVKFASTLSGPADVINAAQFARGAGQVEGLPEYMKILQQNVPGAAFQGTGDQSLVQPLTAESLMAKLGNTDTSREDSMVAWARNFFGQGPGAVAPGVLGSLDENELAMTGAAGAEAGIDVPRWLRDYQRSRLGNESGLLA